MVISYKKELEQHKPHFKLWQQAKQFLLTAQRLQLLQDQLSIPRNITRLTFSCSRSTPRSLHIFRKWENEDWSRRIYALTCRWLQASKRSLKISVSVKESITKAIICNKFQNKSLGCFHSIPREMVREEFAFEFKYFPPYFLLFGGYATWQSSTVQCILLLFTEPLKHLGDV